MESILRRDIENKNIDYCLEYFIGQHMDELSLDFLREVKNKVNWKQIYKDIAYNGILCKLKGKKIKEFFKDIDNDSIL